MDKLEALARAATPGPWHPVLGSGNHMMTALASDHDGFVCDCYPNWATPMIDHRKNMAHIAAWSPERALAALAIIDAAQKILDGDPAAVVTGWEHDCELLRPVVAAWVAMTTPGDV